MGEEEENIPTGSLSGHRTIQETGIFKDKRPGSSGRFVVLLVAMAIVLVAGSTAFFISGLHVGKGNSQNAPHPRHATTPSVPLPILQCLASTSSTRTTTRRRPC
jgi:hypothetical protein